MSNDVTRVQTLLPELSPADRCVWILKGMWTTSYLMIACHCPACSLCGLSIALPQVRLLQGHQESLFERRGTEVVEGVLRHHISACFAALQRKLLDLLHDALPGLRASARGSAPAPPKPFPGTPQSSPAIEVSPISTSHSTQRCVARLHTSVIIKALNVLLVGASWQTGQKLCGPKPLPPETPDMYSQLASAAADLGEQC